VADAIVDVATMPEPPLRLPVGADAVAGIRASLRSQLTDLDAWESRTAAPAERQSITSV
jgi:hypothetical protein